LIKTFSSLIKTAFSSLIKTMHFLFFIIDKDYAFSSLIKTMHFHH
jgi:hypothetical protein